MTTSPSDYLEQPLHEAEFIILDTETTGVEKGVDRPCEIAMILVKGGKILDTKQSLINPCKPMPPEVAAVHHITDTMIWGFQPTAIEDYTNPEKIARAVSPTYEDFTPEMMDFIGHRVTVAHNAQFDMGMLPGLEETNPSLCTLRLARHLWPLKSISTRHPLGMPLNNHQQQTIRYWLNETVDTGVLGAHRALADIQVTSAIFMRQIEDYLKLGHSNTVRGLKEFSDRLISFPTWPNRWGSLQGKEFSEIPSEKLRAYLAKESPTEPIDADFKAYIKFVLDSRRTARPAPGM